MMPSPENVKLKLKRLNNTVKHVLHFIFAGQKLKIFNSIVFLIHNDNTFKNLNTFILATKMFLFFVVFFSFLKKINEMTLEYYNYFMCV